MSLTKVTRDHVSVDLCAPFPPTPGNLTEPLLRVLSRLVDETGNAEQDARIVADALLVELGIDETNLPESWALRGPGKHSIGRATMYAFRNLKVEHCSGNIPLTVQNRPGKWSLTAEGLERGRLLQAGYQEEFDLTPLIPSIVTTVGYLADFTQRPVSREDIQSRLDHELAEYTGIVLHRLNDHPTWGGATQFITSRKGGWALTSAGVRESQRLNGLVAMPWPSQFTLPLLRVLGKGTRFRAGVGLDREKMYRAVLIEAGYDPDNLPLGWELGGREGVHRRIWYAFTYKRAERIGEDKALTVLGPNGSWALTPEGVLTSRAATSNATAAWINKQGMRLFENLREAVGRKFPASRSLNLVEDHVQNWLLKVIRNDGLRKHIEEKTHAQLMNFCQWCCYNQCATDFRSMGHNPASRETSGARTRKEVAAARMVTFAEMKLAVVSHNSIPTVCRQPGHDGVGPQHLDWVDAGAAREVGATIEAASSQAVVDQLLLDAHPEDGPLYVRGFRLKIEGYTSEEIGEKLGCSRTQAGRLVRLAAESLRSEHSLAVLRREGLL